MQVVVVWSVEDVWVNSRHQTTDNKTDRKTSDSAMSDVDVENANSGDDDNNDEDDDN